MTMASATTVHSVEEENASWVPMITIALGQMIMSFNVASLPVALGGMVNSFGVPPTTVATGIVAYSMLVAGFVMLGAKLTQRYGATHVFRVAVAVFGVAQTLMTFSPNAELMITAQSLSGAAGAVIVPSLVALIAENYKGRQQATAVGALGSARAAAGVLAFVIGGTLGTFIGWRPAFGILIAVSAVVFLLSFRLKPDEARPEVRIDFVGVILAAAAIILISFGFNNLNRWGLGLAGPNAPFDLFGVSPAPIMIVMGIVLGQGFLSWTHRQQAAGKTPLLALEVIDSPQGAGGGVCDVCCRSAGSDAQFLGSIIHPDRAGAHAAGDNNRHDALQPHRLLRGDADRAILWSVHAEADRTLWLHPLHCGAPLARLCREE
ncbi:MFS transporter [Bradyrhizobium japonicum]